MPKGVKIKDIVVGTGDLAERGKTVVVNVRMFLNHGTELTGRFGYGPRLRIDLAKRNCIAGLRYGIVGMRVGGQRRLVISPHLAYAADGLPGHVPPNAVIRCDVELLEVRERGVIKPEDYPPGKHLFVFHPGEAARNLSSWQFGLKEDGRCGALITSFIPGLSWRWRQTRHSQPEWHLDEKTTQTLFEWAAALPVMSPGDCLGQDELWADATEPGNAITRDRQHNTLCWTVGIQERGQWTCYFSIRENSPALLSSPLFRIIGGLFAAQLVTPQGSN